MPIPNKISFKNHEHLEEDDFIEIHEWLMNVYDAYECFNKDKDDEDMELFEDDDY